jgi:hypothetical protein
MGRSAGFFEPGWQPGSGSLSAGAFASQDARYNAYHIRAGNGSALREGTYTNNGNGGFTYSQNGSGLMMFNVWLGRQVSPGKFAGRWTSLNRDVAQLMVQKGYSLQLAFSMDQTQSDAQTWYFMSRDGSAANAHGLAYDPSTGMIYEVNHPSRGHGLLLWLEGILLNSVPNNGNKFSETKSVAYQWNMTDDKQRADFWKREGGSVFSLSPVTITNPAAATAWFQSQQGTPWNYNFFTNNCAHYAVQGLNAGGAGVNFIGPKPSSFPIAPTMSWSAGQGPVPIGK